MEMETGLERELREEYYLQTMKASPNPPESSRQPQPSCCFKPSTMFRRRPSRSKIPETQDLKPSNSKTVKPSKSSQEDAERAEKYKTPEDYSDSIERELETLRLAVRDRKPESPTPKPHFKSLGRLIKREHETLRSKLSTLKPKP